MNLREWQPPPMREFHISPKTSSGELEGMHIGNNFRQKTVITDNIVKNVQELLGGAGDGLSLVLGYIKTEDKWDTSRKSGKTAIAHTISPTLAALAQGIHCGMDSPPIVYASGSYFIHEAEGAINILTGSMEDILTEKVRYDGDSKIKKLVKLHRDRTGLLLFIREMEESIYAYAIQNLPHPKLYMEVLDALLFEQRRTIPQSRRTKIVYLLKEGEVLEAHSLAFSTT